MLRSRALTAEQLLVEKNLDPIAACVGAYTLLELGNLEGLHNWTANLMDRFPQVPDGAAIRAEHLARLGKHDEAADAFLALKRRGLPVFLDGVSFVASRLNLYARVPHLIDPDKLNELLRFRQEFQTFAALLSGRRGVSVFKMHLGTNPILETRAAVPSGSG
jgi:hypothetical protein